MTIEQLFAEGWGEIVKSVTHRKHPFHTATYVTHGDPAPSARTVVLRYAQDWVIGCHADYRSPKVKESLANENVSWLFYSFPHKLQIRAMGRTVVHHNDEISHQAWLGSQLLSRRCYLAPLAPSSVSEELTGNIPLHLVDREPVEEESVEGEQNFCVIRTHLDSIDILKLEFTGPSRAKFSRDSGQWLAP